MYFSIIVPDHYKAVSTLRRKACIKSIQQSSSDSYEVIWVHDGPAPDKYWQSLEKMIDADEHFKVKKLKDRSNNWGHSLRDLGITLSTGKYIVHLNADNVLYKDALDTIHKFSKKPLLEIGNDSSTEEGSIFNMNPDVLIFAIRMIGHVNICQSPVLARNSNFSEQLSTILTGWPPVSGMIDAMQLVARREIWVQEGGWFDKSKNSDGIVLPAIAKKYGYTMIPEILGEHW